MRSLWGEPRPADAPGRSGRDWTMAGVFAALAILEALTRPGSHLAAGVALVLTPALLGRRRHPLVVLLIATVALLLVRGEQGYSLAYLLLLPYSLVRWGSGREIVAGSVVAAVPAALFYRPEAGLVVAAGALGLAMRYRAREKARELEQARLRERERIARDLHDTVAHHVSAMAIQAQAGLTRSPVESLLLIEAEAARALAEMRAVVRALGDDRPFVSELARLAAPVHDGPPVDLAIDGNLDNLPPAVGAALFRLAQEAVTNARRHAHHATRIEIRVAADDTSVHLRVTDDGDVRGTDREGLSLTGMRERAVLLGGLCTAGPNPGRGWSVTATLPRTASAG
ncbi:MAG TPA: histidine kinase [Actinoplanes sp.]|jgi:signal transduction histidine kinase